jgi:hypothetical protein
MTLGPSPTRRHVAAMAAAALTRLSAAGAVVSSVVSPASAKDHESGHNHGHGHGSWFGSAFCLLTGTRITAENGLVEIEKIQIGDRVLTHRGVYATVRWIGRMWFDKTPGEPWRSGVMPVKITASAFAPGIPARDLYVSQNHAIFDGSALIAAGYLVNGDTIVQEAPSTARLDYYQLEFEQHEVIYAEGAAVESLRVENQRRGFDNYEDYLSRFGEEDIPPMAPYAPEYRYPRSRDHAVALVRMAVSKCGIESRDRAQLLQDALKWRAQKMKRAA